MAERRLSAHAVVIGSGAGGAPAAAVLAEAGRDVVVLEAGPRVLAPEFLDDEPAMTARLGRMLATADGAQSLYAGACLGGSTVVNDALCWRTPPEVLEAWRREHGLSELEPSLWEPFVDRAWADVHAEPTRRSHINRNAHRLELGARRLEWRGQPMARNVRSCARLGRCNLGCPVNAKQSTLLTYLPRAQRAGARVLARARARRILTQGDRITGVEAEWEGRAGPQTLRIDAEQVLVAAGVLESAALLLRSGIAGGRAGAGHGVQLHSSLAVTARFAEPVHGYFGPTMAYAVTQFSDVLGGQGPGFMIENTSVRPVVTASGLPGFGSDHARAMEALPFLARAVVVLRDRARGRIRVDGRGRASIEYTLSREDLGRLAEGLVATCRAYLAAGAREVWIPIHGVPPVRSQAELARLEPLALDPAQLCFLYAVHLFGGACLGARRDSSFLAPDGSSWDVRGLAVCDASSLPSNTGVNPQITIMANALRIAEHAAATRPGIS